MPFRAHRWLLFSFGVGALVVLASLVAFAVAVPGNLDDAFITLVYARHLAESGSLYWNLQDGAVDGFTSFLDVAIKAGVTAVSGGDLLRSTFWLTLTTHVLVGVSAMVMGGILGWRRSRTWAVILAALAGFAVAANASVADGSAYLLEMQLFTLIALWACGLHVLGDRRRWAWTSAYCVVLGAAVLTRPEGVALVLGLLALHAFERPRFSSSARWVAPFVVLGLLILIYYGWRLATFGHLAPNTYYAKTSASRTHEILDGTRYVLEHARSAGVLGWLMTLTLLVAPAACLLRAWETAEHRRSFLALSGGACGMVLVVVVAGGDCYPGGRFLGLPAALFVLALAFAIARASSPLRRLSLALLVLICIGQLVAIAGDLPAAFSSMAKRWPLSEKTYACERRVADRIADLVGERGSVSQTDFQRLKYFSDSTHVVDLHGLSTAWIAHEPWAEQVTYGKFRHELALRVGAEVWVYGYRQGSRQIPMAAIPTDRLLADPAAYSRFVGYEAPERVRADIKAAYLPASIQECDRFFNFLVRRDVAQRFVGAGVIVGDGEGRPFWPDASGPAEP